jgi:hypothetical protein
MESNLDRLSDDYRFEKSRENALNGPNYSYIKGSPYWVDSFDEGVVIVNDSVRFNKVPLRYNIYNDKMEFLNDKKQVLEIDPSKKNWKFEMKGCLFENIDYSNNDAVQTGIVERLVVGRVALYKKYHVVFKKATKPIGYQDATPDRFERLDDQYLLAIDGQMPQFYRNSKEIVEKLKQLKPDVEAYLKKERINVRKEPELIQLVKYCNQ